MGKVIFRERWQFYISIGYRLATGNLWSLAPSQSNYILFPLIFLPPTATSSFSCVYTLIKRAKPLGVKQFFPPPPSFTSFFISCFSCLRAQPFSCRCTETLSLWNQWDLSYLPLSCYSCFYRIVVLMLLKRCY